jgi:hypothetical protein
MKKFISIFLASAVIVSSFFFRYFAKGSLVSACDDNKVKICHATSSPSNSYVENWPNKSADLAGHDDHSSDIIPSFSYQAWGKTGSHTEVDDPAHWEWRCPTDVSAYTSTSPKDCKWSTKIYGHWHYANKIHVFVAATYKDVDDYGWVTHNYPGKNWDTQNQEIWNNDCDEVEPSITPTDTPTDPGDEVEPSITPTDTPTDPGDQDTEPTPTETPAVLDEQPRGGFSDPSAPVCSDTVPSVPVISSVITTGTNSVKVNWNKVSPANSYSILYGPNSGNYLYSVFSTGDTNSFDIDGISNGCFVVKAVNGCMPGSLSTEVCTSGGTGTGGQVLGASTLGATGNFLNLLYQLALISGTVLTGFGLKKLTSKE